jgi:exosortase
VSDLQLALTGDAYTYILLILPLSFGLMFSRREESLDYIEPGWMVGAILLATGLLFRLQSGWNVFHLSTSTNLSLSVGGLVIFWIGSVIVCRGLNIFKAHLFPLCFLFLIVPMPDHALTWVTGFLQHKSAWAATILFRASGVPVARDGIMLSIPGLDIEVARECSSIRSSTMLFIVTLTLAQLFLRTSWRKTLLVLAVIPMSVAKNSVRIITIAELGTKVDQSFLDGRLHHHGGIVFLGLALLGVVVLLWVLRKCEKHRVEPSSP